MKILDKIIERIVDSKIAEVKGQITFLDEKILKCIKEIDKIKEILSKIDQTIALMTYSDLEKKINNRLTIFEGGIDDKMVGLYKAVDEKVHNGNGSVTATAGLMKRIAFLEGIKDAVNARISTEEIIKKRDEYQEKLLSIDKNGGVFQRYKDIIDTLNWVLGEKDG